MNRYNSDFLRINAATQIDTSNTAMNDNNLDFSGGANSPLFSQNRVFSPFKDSDFMYSQKFDPDEIDEQTMNEVNSVERAKGIPSLTEN